MTTISEDDERPGGLAVRQRLEHHVVAALGQRRAIPRAVEGDERTAPVQQAGEASVAAHAAARL